MERASICDGRFWCALGQNSWFLVEKLQNYDNFMEKTNQETGFDVLGSLFYYLYLKNDNLKQKT